MKANDFNRRLKAADELLSAREALELAGACGSPAPNSVDGAKHSARLDSGVGFVVVKSCTSRMGWRFKRRCAEKRIWRP